MSHTYKFVCRFCGTETGSVTFQYAKPKDSPLNEVNDTRCSTCEGVFGSYPAMEKDFKERGLTKKHSFADVIKKANYKKAEFYKILTTLEL